MRFSSIELFEILDEDLCISRFSWSAIVDSVDPRMLQQENSIHIRHALGRAHRVLRVVAQLSSLPVD